MKDSMRVAALGLFAALGATCGILVALELDDAHPSPKTPDAVEITTQATVGNSDPAGDDPSENRFEPPPPLADLAPMEPYALADLPNAGATAPADAWQSAELASHHTDMDVAHASQPDARGAPFVAEVTAPNTAGAASDLANGPALMDESEKAASANENDEEMPPAWDAMPAEQASEDAPPLRDADVPCLLAPPAECEPACGTPDAKGELDKPITHDDSSLSSDNVGQDVPDESFDVPVANAPVYVVRNPKTSEPIASIRIGGEVCSSVPVPVAATSAAQSGATGADPTAEPLSVGAPLAAQTIGVTTDEATLQVKQVHHESDVPPGKSVTSDAVAAEANTVLRLAPVVEHQERPPTPRSAEEVIAQAGDSVFAEAVALLEAGQSQVALDLLKAAGPNRTNPALYYELLGEALVRMSKWQSASRALSMSLRIDKRSARANYLMGIALIRLGEQNRGEHYLLQAHDMDARYPLNPWTAR